MTIFSSFQAIWPCQLNWEIAPLAEVQYPSLKLLTNHMLLYTNLGQHDYIDGCTTHVRLRRNKNIGDNSWSCKTCVLRSFSTDVILEQTGLHAASNLTITNDSSAWSHGPVFLFVTVWSVVVLVLWQAWQDSLGLDLGFWVHIFSFKFLIQDSDSSRRFEIFYVFKLSFVRWTSFPLNVACTAGRDLVG